MRIFDSIFGKLRRDIELTGAPQVAVQSMWQISVVLMGGRRLDLSTSCL